MKQSHTRQPINYSPDIPSSLYQIVLRNILDLVLMPFRTWLICRVLCRSLFDFRIRVNFRSCGFNGPSRFQMRYCVSLCTGFEIFSFNGFCWVLWDMWTFSHIFTSLDLFWDIACFWFCSFEDDSASPETAIWLLTYRCFCKLCYSDTSRTVPR